MDSRRILIALVLAALLLRLANIADDDVWLLHPMRQTDTAAMARNLYRDPSSLLTPMLDSGFLDMETPPPVKVALEFPVYTGPIAAAYALFGVEPVLGRVFSALCSVAALPFFWALSRRILGPDFAILATAFLALSYEFVVYGRMYMPDATGALLAVASLELWLGYLDDRRQGRAVIAGLATMLAILVKITNAYVVGVVLLVALQSRDRRSLLDGRLLPVMAGSLGIALLYYAHVEKVSSEPVVGQIVTRRVLPYLVTNLFTPSFYRTLLLYGVASLGPVGIAAGLAGIGLGIARRDRIVTAWSASLAVYLLIIGRDILAHHSYYFLHVLPLLATGCAVATREMGIWLRRRAPVFARTIPLALVLAIISWSLAFYGWRLVQEASVDQPEVVHARKAAAFIQAKTGATERVAVFDDDSLLTLHLADRKGWSLSPQDRISLTALRERGCDAVFVDARGMALIDRVLLDLVAMGEAGSIYRFRSGGP